MGSQQGALSWTGENATRSFCGTGLANSWYLARRALGMSAPAVGVRDAGAWSIRHVPGRVSTTLKISSCFFDRHLDRHLADSDGLFSVALNSNAASDQTKIERHPALDCWQVPIAVESTKTMTQLLVNVQRIAGDGIGKEVMPRHPRVRSRRQARFNILAAFAITDFFCPGDSTGLRSVRARRRGTTGRRSGAPRLSILASVGRLAKLIARSRARCGLATVVPPPEFSTSTSTCARQRLMPGA